MAAVVAFAAAAAALAAAAARMATVANEDKDNSTVDNITGLPDALLFYALDFLPFEDMRHFHMGSIDLWNNKRPVYEAFLRALIPPVPPPITDMLHMKNIRTLNLGTHCSDAVLCDMRHKAVLPNLEHLSMVGSDITDQGLAYLVENSVRCETLQSLDITFCKRTTFEVTLLLRDRLIKLRIVRRQPEWMDGVLHSGSEVHMYTVYWADGTTVYYRPNGEIYLCTYFRNLFDEGPSNRLVAKKQVVFTQEFERRQDWRSQPEWLQHVWRPGEMYLYIPNTKSVLRAIPERSNYPVQGFPRPEDAHMISLNSGRIFNRQGKVCRLTDPNTYVLVNHFQLQSLDAPMPPQDVVNLCRDQMERSKVVMAGRNQETDERFAHFQRGGNQDDVPPPYWFQY